jgi:hypothetical protein
MGGISFRPLWRVPAGESKRFLVNIALNLESLKVQGFSLTRSLYGMKIGIARDVLKNGRFLKDVKDCLAVSEPIEFRAVDFPAQELSALTNKPRFTMLGAPVMKEAVTPEDCRSLKSKELRETVALSSLLHRILTVKDISTISVSDYLPFLGEWLLPELEQIEFEVLLAKGEKDKAAMAKAAILERFPAMRFWVDEAERGAGLCVAIRTGSR